MTDEDIGMSNLSTATKALLSAMFVIGGLAMLYFFIEMQSEVDSLRFEALCYHPRQIDNVSCFVLQEAIMVCPEASELFYEMNCPMANRTMVMVLE